MDWALIESWKEMKVPLHVALRGIEKSFDSWESKPRKRTIKTLLYCQEEVEAQYAEWLDSRVGGGKENGQPPADLQLQNLDESTPFPRSAVLEHLNRVRAELSLAGRERGKTAEDDLSEALARAAIILEELEQDFAQAVSPSSRKLEDSLTGLERMLTDSLLSVVGDDQLDALSSEVETQLRPYRKHMDQQVYKQTKDNLLLKRLREEFAVPRLSLFYL